MTAINHVMTGAVIALAFKRPEFAIPLAFLSHYICDIIPHFGIYEDDVIRRNAHWLFRTVVVINIIGMLLLLCIVPHAAADKGNWLTVLLSMVAAILPDAAWVPLFIREVRTKQWRPAGSYSRFHQFIQWYEKPQGLIIEALWLGCISWGMVRLLA